VRFRAVNMKYLLGGLVIGAAAAWFMHQRSGG
jgi:hypothetical protein